MPGPHRCGAGGEVRARVSGILLEKTFEEGGEVKAGDTLFKIDQAPLEAVKENANAALVRAQATQHQADTQLARYKTLVGSNAVSKQQFDDAESAVKVADAEVNAAKAALEDRRVASRLRQPSRLRSPADIGRAAVTERRTRR